MASRDDFNPHQHTRHRFAGFNRKDYYRTEEWKRIRDGYLARNPRCYGCGGKATLVHHEAYTYVNLSGMDESYLYPICRKCHYYCHFDHGKKVDGLLNVARRLRKRRRWMLDTKKYGKPTVYISPEPPNDEIDVNPRNAEAQRLHQELDARLDFLLANSF